MSDDPIRQQAQALVDRLDLIVKNKSYQAVFACAWNHGCEYDGPNFESELRNLKAALSSQSAPPPAETKEQDKDLSASAPARSPASSADAGTETLPNK